MSADFPTFSKSVHDQYTQMSSQELYKVDVQDIFASYLAAFPEGTNEVFRQRTEHDCNCCKNFIRNLGTVVSIDGDVIITVWDNYNTLPYPYNVVAETMRDIVRQAPIVSVYRTKERQYGVEYNYDTETSRKWNHFHGAVGRKHYSVKPDADRGSINTSFNVFQRALNEISVETVNTVIELTNNNDIYRGMENIRSLRSLREALIAYNATFQKTMWVWANLEKYNNIAHIRGTSIGTLLVAISEGTDLAVAVSKYEAMVAPTNYKRPKSLVTTKMINEAAEKIEKLGVNIKRRLANISDVSVNNVLYVSNRVVGNMKGGIHDLLADQIKPANHIKIESPTKVSVSDFFEHVLPGKKELQLLVEPQHFGNFVTITTADGETGAPLFKWNNNFAWSYDGNVADSVKARVKAAGGNVDALFRVSLAWFNTDDLDIHIETPVDRISYQRKYGRYGILDVDMNISGDRRDAVENIHFTKMVDGRYKIIVHNFTPRESIDVGCTVDIEGIGTKQQFVYNKPVRGYQEIATFDVKNNAITSLKNAPDVTNEGIAQTKWGLTSGNLVNINSIMLSPNYWDDNAVGNKHWFFLLEGCKTDDAARGIYNEFLRGDLDAHRKVFEVLADKTKCPPSESQLSGLGFSSTKKDSAIIVVDKRPFEVVFG